MQTKLTLRLDKERILFGKRWAKQHGKSLSQLIEDYLATLEEMSPSPTELPPLTKSLIGLAQGMSEEDYKHYLETKYL